MMVHALRYASEGFYVFPVYEPLANGCSCSKAGCRGKHPRTVNGVKDATTDANKIKEWWQKWPNASIGLATGAISGVSVVDLDGAEGIASGRSLGLTSTVTALTGNGKQLFYADSQGNLSNSVKKIAAGLDTRGNGGYVVVPPSLHPCGKRYVWERGPLSRKALQPCPNLTQVSTVGIGGVVGKPDGWIAEALGGMKHGNIDNTLVSVLGRMRRDGYSEHDALVLLTPHAERAGATPGHLEDKVRHIWKSYQAAPRALNEQSNSGSETIDAFLQEAQEVEWICKPIIAKKSIGFVAGLPETCKTWLLMDLAVEATRGSGSWLGLFPLPAAQRVLFIDQERFKGETQRRFSAVIAAKSLQKEDLKDSLFIKCGTTIKLDLEASYQAFRAELLELRPSLVLIDSFATFHNKPENDRMAIQEVLNRIKALRDEVGCSFVFINHESKMVFQHVEENKTPTAFDMLGSVGIVAAAEFVLVVRKIEAGMSMVHHVKSTLATASKSFTVQLSDVGSGVAVKGTI